MVTKFNLQEKQFVDSRQQMEYLYTQAFESVCTSDSESAILEEIRNDSERYTIIKTIAEGGAKFIHLVEDIVTGRTLAMAVRKEKSSDEESEGFLREARITSVLQHPNILPVYDMGINEQQQPFFTMKYIEGENLRQLLENDKISLSDKIDIFYKVCDAVAYAHSCGVLHLDLKPENIQISSYGEVLVCDWGLAEILDSHCNDPHIERYSFDKIEQKQNLHCSIKGTPGYMAPEQVLQGRRKDQRTDIFTLGAILYEIITSKPAINGGIEECLNQTESNPTICFGDTAPQESLLAIAYKCMQLDPEMRYQCVDEVIIDLKAYREGFVTSAEEAPLWRHLQLFYKRHQTTVQLTGIFCLIVIIATIFSFISIHKSEQAAIAAHDALLLEQRERARLGREAAPRIFKQAEQFFSQGNFIKAKERAETALMLDDKSAKVRTLLGILLFMERKYERANNLLKSANTPLEKSVRDLNNLYCQKKYTPDQERTSINNLLLYCSRLMPTPLTIALCFNWINSENKAFQNKAMWSLKVSKELSMRVLNSVAKCNNENIKNYILSQVLHQLEQDPEWLQRRIPATLGMQLSTNDQIKKRFKALIPANLALGQHVFSNGGDERYASYAVDGETKGEFWAGNPFPAHITVDLNRETIVKKFKVYFYYGPEKERYYQYLIQTSVDGIIYQTVVDQSSNKKYSSPVPFEHNLPPISARYVRLVVTHNSANEAVHVNELEVF
ncbi:protein kinase [Lentisphaerota bacterium WC36G]|nr:protein kinase [Lentisphaerae bacterium WC36]